MTSSPDEQNPSAGRTEGDAAVPPRPTGAPPGYGSQPEYGQQPGYGSQPYAAPGSGPYPAAGQPHTGQQQIGQPPGPPQAGKPFSQGPFGALALGATWQAALVPAGIALLAGILVSIILSSLLVSLGDLSSLTEDMGMSGGSIGYALPFVLLALALGGSGVFRMNASYDGAVGLDGAVHLVGAPLLISVVTLGLLWWLTKRSEMRTPSQSRSATWLRIGISTLAFTLVLFVLQLIFAARLSISDDGGFAALEFSAVTARSFFLPLLVVLVTIVWGRVAGHFKGAEAIGAPFLRWAVPAGHVALVHAAVVIAVLSVVALIALPVAGDIPWKLVPLLFLNAGVILASIVHLGGVSASAMGALASYTDSASADLTLFSEETPGHLWWGVLVVLAAVLLSTLVSTVTRRPHWTVVGDDPHQWASMWRTPLAFLILWGVISLLVIPIHLSVRGSGELLDELTGTGAMGVGIGALPWSFLLFAVWGGIVEVLSRTLGPRLVMTVPAVAKFLAGRAIHPYWGQTLGMDEPRGALIHPDIAAEMAAQGRSPAAGPQAPAYGSVPPPPHSAPPTAAPQAFGAQTGAAPAQPFDRKKAKVVGIVAGALAVVIVGGVIVVTQLNGRMFGPEAVAQKYFSALSDGDAEAALRLADVDVPAEQRALLTNEVLGGATALPQDVVVQDAQVSDGTAAVDVSFDLAGSKDSVTLTMRKAGKTALFFDDWALQSPDLAHLMVGTPGLDAVRVNGAEVPTGSEGVDLPAFPALYTVGLAEESELVEAEDVTSRVFFSGAETDDGTYLDAQPTEAFRSEVDTQVRNLIDSCASKTDLEPQGCPFRSSSGSYRDEVQDVAWSIEEYPTVSLTTGEYNDDVEATTGDQWYVSTDTSGEALVTGTYLDWFDDRETFDDTVTFWIAGTVEIIDGKVVVNVEPASSDW